MAKRELNPLYADYAKQLKGPFELSSTILLWGPSAYLQHKALLSFKKRKQPQVQIQFYDPQSLSRAVLEEQLSQDDMFRQPQWVVIRRAEQDRSLHKKLKDLKISPTNKLIISHQGGQLPKNVEKNIVSPYIIPCFEPKPYELPQFARALGKSLGIEITLEQAEALLTLTGDSLDALDNELQILSLAYHDQSTKTAKPDAIVSHIEKQKEESCFRITDFLVRGDIPQALLCLETLLQQGEAPLAMLGILAKHCRTVLAFQEGLLPQGYIPRTQQQLYRSYAQKLSRQQCRQAILKCGIADRLLKTSKTPAHLALSDIIWELSSSSMIK